MRYFLFAALIFKSTYCLGVEPLLIGGNPAEAGQFPEVVSFSGSGRCTATIVGPQTIVTAEHCLASINYVFKDGIRYSVNCEAHPEIDIAFCSSPVSNFPKPHASVSKAAAVAGQPVVLLGLGCQERGGGDRTYGELNWANSSVTAVNFDKSYWYHVGDVALCFGDSGGPAFTGQEPQDTPRTIVGINSRGDIQRFSLIEDLGKESARNFASYYADTYNYSICGISEDCGEIIEPENCDKEEIAKNEAWLNFSQCRRTSSFGSCWGKLLEWARKWRQWKACEARIGLQD